MKLKLIKKNGKSYVQLPEGFERLDEVEFFRLRDDFWLLSSGLGSGQDTQKVQPQPESAPAETGKQAQKKLGAPETAVLKKLMDVRFADRTPAKMDKLFSTEEKSALRSLIKSGFVQVFYGNKYSKTGVYNISDSVYPHAGKQPGGEAEQQKEGPQTAAGQNPSAPAHMQSQPPPAYSELTKVGWIIIANPKDAENFSIHLKESGLSNNVKGVRGFDGRFYVSTNKFLYSTYEKIRPLLEKKKETHLAELSQLANIEPEGVSVVLHLLAESGEVIEKKRDLFCLA